MDIVKVNQELLKLPQAETTETHLFEDGMYCRQIEMSAGSLIIGHRHKKPGINILAKGRILIKTAIEEEWTEIEAPFVNSTPAGMRKFLYIVEDAVFMNIFRTDETSLDKLYEECVYPEEGTKPYLEAQEAKKLLKEG